MKFQNNNSKLYGFYELIVIKQICENDIFWIKAQVTLKMVI
jgi:hypothetical protein